MTSSDFADYGDGDNHISGTNYDWGRYNKISNGGNIADNWRTLTYDEWKYIVLERANAESLHAHVTVMGIKGYLLLPDGWSMDVVSTHNDSVAWDNKTYTNSTTWAKMDEAGAIFLPCAGFRRGENIQDINAILHETRHARAHAEGLTRFCVGCDGGGVCMVAAYSVYRHVSRRR